MNFECYLCKKEIRDIKEVRKFEDRIYCKKCFYELGDMTLCNFCENFFYKADLIKHPDGYICHTCNEYNQ